MKGDEVSSCVMLRHRSLWYVLKGGDWISYGFMDKVRILAPLQVIRESSEELGTK
jgi:hypothetical protein